MAPPPLLQFRYPPFPTNDKEINILINNFVSEVKRLAREGVIYAGMNSEAERKVFERSHASIAQNPDLHSIRQHILADASRNALFQGALQRAILRWKGFPGA